MITENDITVAYRELYATKKDYETKDVDYIEAKAELDSTFAKAIASGSVTGKNADERKGQLDEMFAGKIKELKEQAREVAKARLNFDLATINVSRLQALLRLQEVLAKVEEAKDV